MFMVQISTLRQLYLVQIHTPGNISGLKLPDMDKMHLISICFAPPLWGPSQGSVYYYHPPPYPYMDNGMILIPPPLPPACMIHAII